MCTGNTDLTGVKAIQWGVEHEQEAIRAYEEATGNKVEPCGLLLAPNGLLGASPDGLVGQSVVLEVKCPWRLRQSSISELCDSDKTFFIAKSHDGGYYLKSDHSYYHQVQGQMYLSCRSECHLVIWSEKEVLILQVPKDPDWQGNLATLSQFYSTHILPKFIEAHTSRQM